MKTVFDDSSGKELKHIELKKSEVKAFEIVANVVSKIKKFAEPKLPIREHAEKLIDDLKAISPLISTTIKLTRMEPPKKD